MKVDLFYPYVNEEMRQAVNETLHSRFIGQGKKVDQFERDFCKKFNVPFATSVNSGTAALEQAYDLIGIKEGDEVITTPLTCSATNIPLYHRKAKIIFADIDENTLCIDPEDVMRKLGSNTKAIVQVHLGGIESLVHMVEGLTIPLVSDAAQALGIFVGDYTCCSFQAIKHITTGDGGMTVLNNEAAYNRAKKMRWFGIDREEKEKNNWQACTGRLMTCDIEEAGYKRHMNDIAASMGIVGLKYYDEIIEHRKKIFNIYKEGISTIDGIRLVDGPNNTYWLATVVVDRRDDLINKLWVEDIDVNVVQLRNDILTIFGGKRQDLPVMNKLEHSYFSLPLNMTVTEDDANYIVSLIRKGW